MCGKRWIIVVASIGLIGVQAGCQAPAPGTWAARRQANIGYVVDLTSRREARRPLQLQQTTQWVANEIAGHPDQAEATFRRVFELD